MSNLDGGPAFVAGATGYTGREVVRALRDAGVEVIAHVRPDSPQGQAWQQRFAQQGASVDFTPWQQDALISTFEQLRPKLVFGLVGTTRARANKEERDGLKPSYDSVDYGLTKMLIEAACQLSPRPRFIYLSATGLPKSEPRKGSYMHARWRVERALEASDLPYVAARPSFITGPDRDESRPAETVGARIADAALAVAGTFGLKRLRERYRSTSNVILANALVHIGLDPSQARCTVESDGLR